MSLVLDENSVRMLENIIEQCKEHRPLTQKVLYGKEDRVTNYPKFKNNTQL